MYPTTTTENMREILFCFILLQCFGCFGIDCCVSEFSSASKRFSEFPLRVFHYQSFGFSAHIDGTEWNPHRYNEASHNSLVIKIQRGDICSALSFLHINYRWFNVCSRRAGGKKFCPKFATIKINFRKCSYVYFEMHARQISIKSYDTKRQLYRFLLIMHNSWHAFTPPHAQQLPPQSSTFDESSNCFANRLHSSPFILHFRSGPACWISKQDFSHFSALPFR